MNNVNSKNFIIEKIKILYFIYYFYSLEAFNMIEKLINLENNEIENNNL